MPRPVIDAVAVSATDLAASRAFYTRLGFDFEGEGAFVAPEHIEPVRREGEPRLMIDTAQMMERLTGEAPRAPNHSILALLCADAAEVDRVAASVAAAGHAILTPPWDAPWGQRYATIADPDGYRIDLFAPL